MSRLLIGLKTFFLITVATLVLASCGKDSTDQSGKIGYPEETAKLISQVTSGVIASDDEIRVRFTSEIIKQNIVGQTVSEKVFEFSPGIDGVTKWENVQTLVFKPNAKLPMREKYSGKLIIEKLLPKLADKNPLPLEFNFEVAGREIAKATTDFELRESNNPRFLMVSGEIAFTEPAEPEAVKKATSLKLDGQSLAINWTPQSGDKTFRFTSAEFERGSKRLNFELAIDDSPLALSQDYQKKFNLSPLSNLEVQDIQPLIDSENPGISITFSDELDATQDISGMISVVPQTTFNLKKMGKEVVLTGGFNHGETYDVQVLPGIRSRFGTRIAAQSSMEVSIEELKPQIKFAGDGVFLPSANEQKVLFSTLNVRKVRLQVMRVYENNLGQFLQTEQIESGEKRSESFNNMYVNRVGVSVFDDKLEIGETRNTWLQHELDFKQLIPRGDKGLYLLHISFEMEDMLYGTDEEREAFQNRRGYYDDYYSSPYSYGYLYSNGNIYKPIISTDIGLTYKKAFNKHIVFATNLLTTNPISGATVRFKSYQNQLLNTASTNNEGMAEFATEENNVFYIEVEDNGQRSVIKPNEMGWNLSTFDTDGINDVAKGTRAFIYTERGVFRPGDAVNFSVIARNEDGTFPENHPVTMTINNPLGQKVFESTNRQATDGFYHFQFQGSEEDPTGNYAVNIKAGSSDFGHTLKIETVAPFRLKVQLTPEKTTLFSADRFINLNLHSQYLFGNPANGLLSRTNIYLQKQPPVFSKFKNFVFDNQTLEFQTIDMMIDESRLDSNGDATIRWQLPETGNAPTALSARFESTVLEKGGRPNTNSITVPIHPFDRYVGIQLPEFDWGYAKVGNELNIQSILVDTDGKVAPGNPLNYRIYKGMRYWWWEYEDREDFRMRFKSHRSTDLFAEGSIVSQSLPAGITFTPPDNGMYLIEIQDGDNGHTAGVFMNAYRWGDAASGRDAGLLALKTDKDQYQVGETATVTFPAPKEGRILVTMEKGQRVLSTGWLTPTGDEQMEIPIELTTEMTPTVYLTLSVIQPHSQTGNDRPMRTYGVVPLNVENRSSRQFLEIDAPKELRSKAPFSVKVRTTDKQPTQFTIAVVDEGLLDITAFKTPDPWKYFFQKLRLGVESFDLFGHVIGANKGDIFRTFSIGGGMEDYRESQSADNKRRRFKPVAMFRGPLQTDKNGEATVDFEMPNYIGSVRVMVISATGNRYGSAEQAIPVKTELMVQPSLPRVIGAGDEFAIPTTVFAMKEGIGDVTVSMKMEGPLEAISPTETQLNFPATGDKDVMFRVKAKPAIGPAKITISVKSANFSAEEVTEIDVRANSPRVSSAEKQSIETGKSVSMLIPNRGIAGSNNASITVSLRPNLDLGQRLWYLIRYPYGCIEQTTSAVFPQLFLKDFIGEATKRQSVARRAAIDIDANINGGISRLRRFKLPSGGFSYWPGNREVSSWGTNYAGHFLLEAKNLGYSVPQDLLDGWVKFQQSMANTTRDDLLTRTYRVYLLAKAGKPHLAAMNLLKENSLKEMKNTEKWLLAGAYYLAGVKNVASEITKNLNTSVNDYWEFGNTFGSTLRDRAIILENLQLMGNWTEADNIANEISEAISNDQWYSTHTLGFCMLSLGKYLNALKREGADKPRLVGNIALPDGSKIPFDTDDWAVQIPIESGFGEHLTVSVDGESSAKRTFTTLIWDGIPLQSDMKTEQKNLALTVEWLNEDGAAIDPANVTQGQVFWAHFRVKNSQRQYRNIENVALVQVLPTGWEVQNTRLSGEEMPGWMNNYRLNRENYLDIRDDRVMWFFDLNGYEGYADFVVKLNAVTVGEFSLPAAIAEAMYNEEYQASVAGKTVLVKSR